MTYSFTHGRAKTEESEKNRILNSLSGRGLEYYGDFDKRIRNRFDEMQRRVKEGNLLCDFANNRLGLKLFCEVLGPYPENMIDPTVGRTDNHKNGYLISNISWQSRKDNLDEMNKRLIESGDHHMIKNNPVFTLVICPHCNYEGPKPQLTRWHFDNCKHRR
jgi:hypothetical protein